MNQKILVIEDNAEMRENIAGILELAQYEVLLAPNGKIGVELAQKEKPDLILCDIMMPELDGYGVLHILAKDHHTAGIPFIFLTARSETADVRTGMSLGADDYITKPFDGFELLKIIEVRLRKHELIKSSFEHQVEGMDDFFERAKQLQEFQGLSKNRQVRRVRKKDFLFMEGHEPIDLYYLSKGQVKTFKTTQEGKELVTGIHHEGAFLGYVPLLENTPHTESAVAMEDTEVYLIPKDDFHSLIYANREVALKFMKLLSNNLTEAEERLLHMAYQSVRQRVAGSLLKIHSQLTAPEGGVIAISRRDISGIVGTATESLNRTLADFRDEGLIEISDHGIRVLDLKKLGRIAH